MTRNKFNWKIENMNGTLSALQSRLVQSACVGHLIGKQDMLNHLESLRQDILKMPEESPLED